MSGPQGPDIRHNYEFVSETRAVYAPDPELQVVSSPNLAARIAKQHIGQSPVECVLVVLLDTRHRPQEVEIVSRGTVGGASCVPRDVYRLAVARNAASIIVAHNHPSGDVRPSDADTAVTERLRLAGEAIGIDMLDHLIVSHRNPFYSFAERKTL